MIETVSPAKAIHGVITLPGDKSISHRYGMLAAIAEGSSTLTNYSTGADCQSTLGAMAAVIEARDSQYPPLTVCGGPLHGIDYTLPVASAQVKSCVLLAGLFAQGDTIVREPVRTRDHTEIALREFGAEITVAKRVITLRAGAHLTGRELYVPGDLSSACFFLVAALLMPEADLVIHGVGLNPTRSQLLDFLVGMGASIKVLDLQQSGGELIGDLRVRASKTSGGLIEGAMTAALIDEIPALAVLGAASSGGLTVRDASELRIKETDRIAVLEENFRHMHVRMDPTPDGFHIPGGQRFHAAELDSAGDHRIAMAFAVAALAADGPCVIQRSEAASVSFPEFYAILR